MIKIEINLNKIKMIMAMVFFTIVVILSGCGKEEPLNEVVVEKNEEILVENEEFSIEHEFDDLSEEILNNVPNLDTLTQEQLRDMTIDEFRAFIKVYCPDFRNVYSITSNGEMSKEDWETLKRLVNYNLFNELWFESEDSISSNSVSENEVIENESAFIKAVEWSESGYTVEEIEEMILIISESENEVLKSLLLEVFKENDFDMENLENIDEESLEFLKTEMLNYLINIKKEIEALH